MPTHQEIVASQTLIIDTFKGFRSELMQAYGRINHDTKGDDSPVTRLDVMVEETLKAKLQAQFPAFGFKGEETEEILSTNDAIWYVDPIDSTRSFIHGLPYCSNMAGLVVGGEIVASVIYHFASDELFTALKGHGAYRNGERISVKDTTLLDSCIFTDAYSYKNAYGLFAPDGVRFYAPMGATGYFMTRLAQGSVQGVCYLRSTIKQHDVIPGMLLVKEAGGGAVSFTGKPLDHTCLAFMAGTKSVCELTTKHLDKLIQMR